MITHVRCCICGRTNTLVEPAEMDEDDIGDGFSCGWCCGLTLIAELAPPLAHTARRTSGTLARIWPGLSEEALERAAMVPPWFSRPSGRKPAGRAGFDP